MRITELPPFNPRLEDYHAEEFLAHTLLLLEYPIEQNQEALDLAPFQVKAPPPPPEPRIPLLPHVWYPKPVPEVAYFAPNVVKPSRPLSFLGAAAPAAAETVMRPLLAGAGPVTVQGASGMGKTTLLYFVATHEKTRQRFRRIWYFDDPERVGQLGAILLGSPNVLAQSDIYRQFALLSNDLDDDILLVIDNLTPDHGLLLACQTLSPYVLLAVETPPEPPADETDAALPEDPPNVVTLRRWSAADALELLAHNSHLQDRKGIPRELRPVLEEIAAAVDYHPLGLSVIASMVREDELPPTELLEHLRMLLAEPAAQPSPELALKLCIETLPAEYIQILEAFASFSPLGVSAQALRSTLTFRHELSFQRGLSLLKRRCLIRADHRFRDHYIAAEAVYRRMAASDPHLPGKLAGERMRDWLIRYVDQFAYDPLALFEVEAQLRHAYRVTAQHKLYDFSARLNPALHDYLRTYLPALLPHDAPPPRLTGDRAKAVQLARHGLELAESGDIPQGREVLKSALEALQTQGSTHDQAQAWVMLGRLEDLAGDYPKAIAALETAAKLVYDLNAAESVSLVRLGLAMAYRHQGRLRDALAVLDERPEADAERARIYRAMGDFKAMAQVLGKPSDMTPYARAESYLQAGLLSEALAAIAEDNTPQSHYLRALIYHLQGDYEHALLGYQQALSHFPTSDPDRSITARAMASIYALQGDFDQAERTLNQTLEDLKASGDAAQQGRTLGLLAAVHLRCGNNRTAIETASQALQKLLPLNLHSDIGDAYRTLGRACWRLERYEDALKAFLGETEHVQSEARRDETRIGLAFFHTAEAYRMVKQLDKAVVNHRRALTHIHAQEQALIYFIIQSALHRTLLEAERHKDALEVNEAALAHLDEHPPQDLQHMGYMLGQNVRAYQRLGKHSQAYKSFARWLNLLTGRADALTDEGRPLVGLLALSLAARSLMTLGRTAEALPLAADALRAAEEHIKRADWMPVVWAARRDYGEALLAAEQWQAALAAFQPVLKDEVKQEPHTYAAVFEGAGIALYQMGEYRQALAHFGVAQDFQPAAHKQGLILERVANTHLALGETARAVENFNEALKLLDRKAFPGVAARVLTALAHTLAGINRYADAIAVYEDALGMLRALPDASPLYTAQVYVSLGHSNEIQGQLPEAARAYRSALETLESQHVNAPQEYRGILLRLARVLVMLKDYNAAIPFFERARDEAHHWGTQQEVGNITRELAEAERDGGYLARSLKTYEDGLELLPLDYALDRAALLRSYGMALAAAQQFEQARKAWNEALAITQEASPLEIALTHHAIGQAFRAQKDFAAAEAAFRKALEFHPRGKLEEAATYRELGETLLEAGRPEEAFAPLEAALDIEKALPQQSNARLVKTLQLLGLTEERRARRQNAITLYHAALVYMDRSFQPEPYAETLRTLGRLYAEGMAWEECQKALNEALDIELSLKPRSEERLAATFRMIADAYRQEGHLEKAANAYKKMATYANLSAEDANKLRATLDDIERHTATLTAALDSLTVLEKTGAEPKSFVFVYALIVRMYYLLSQMEQSRAMMNKLIKFLQTHAEAFSIEDERPDYRSLAHLRLALQYEKQGDKARTRDHYRLALKDNTDTAMAWLIEKSMEAVA